MTMEEDEAELLQTLTAAAAAASAEPTLAPIPPPPIAAIPPPPPIAPIPTPKPQTVFVPTSANADDYEISDESRLARERQEKALQELLLKRRSYAMAVPTNDSAVRSRLRRLGEPVTLFGEREMERRDRLRSLMLRLDSEGQLDRLLKAHDDEQSAADAADEADEGERVSYPFYTEGSKELLETRKEIVVFSIARMKARLKRAKRRRDDPDEDEEGEAREAEGVAEGFALDCSEIGDDRPLSGCSYSSDGTMLATRYDIPYSYFENYCIVTRVAL